MEGVVVEVEAIVWVGEVAEVVATSWVGIVLEVGEIVVGVVVAVEAGVEVGEFVEDEEAEVVMEDVVAEVFEGESEGLPIVLVR